MSLWFVILPAWNVLTSNSFAWMWYMTHVNILEQRIIYCVYILTAFPVKFSAESTTQHWLFYKEHSVREKNASKPSNRTLFIINVPPYCSEVIKNITLNAFFMYRLKIRYWNTNYLSRTALSKFLVHVEQWRRCSFIKSQQQAHHLLKNHIFSLNAHELR